MLTHTPEASQALESSNREFTHRLLIDWNNDKGFDHALSDMSPYVTRTSRDQSLSSTAPEELMLIEGYAAAQLDIVVAGDFEGISLNDHFAPYNSRSTFYTSGVPTGVEMEYSIGVLTENGWEWFRQFTGVLREIETDRAAGEVTFNCLDNVEKMRTPFDISPYAGHRKHLEQGFKRGGLIDSSSVIDLAARSAGFYAKHGEIGYWSDPNINTILSVPFHGSLLPEVGMIDNLWEVHKTEQWENGTDAEKANAEAYRDGPQCMTDPFGKPTGYLALNSVPPGQESIAYKKYWIDEQTPYESPRYYAWSGSWGLSAWVYWPGNNVFADSAVVDIELQNYHLQLVIENSNGGVNGKVIDPSNNHRMHGSTWQFMSPGWNQVYVGFGVYTSGTSVTKVDVVVSCNGSVSTKSDIPSSSFAMGNDLLSGLVVVQNVYAISDVKVIYCNYSDWGQYVNPQAYDFNKGNSYVDWGRNRAMYTLKRDSLTAWDVAKEVAAAEYGAVFFDEEGKFNFWNFDTVTRKAKDIVRELSIDKVQGLSMRLTTDTIRNHWSVDTKTAYADWGIAYDLSQDGPPLTGPHSTTGGVLNTTADRTDFRVAQFEVSSADAGVDYEYFWIRSPENMICPNPNRIPDAGELGDWTSTDPYHLKKPYTGNTYVGGLAGDIDKVRTEQKWVGPNLVRMSIRNVIPGTNPIGFWLNAKDQGRFRFSGTMVYEDQKSTTYSMDTNRVDDEIYSLTGQHDPYLQNSISRYGRRTIDLGNNFWLQDWFQTRNMLRSVIQKFGRPIPVTDNVTIPGDPRIQIGDTIVIRDPEGFGDRIALQIYGISRKFDIDSGLTDTYQVEVVENSGVGLWDDASYGLWDDTLIWS